jgi:cell division septation protein DedD
MQNSKNIFRFRSILVVGALSLCLGLAAQNTAYHHLVTGSFAKFEDASTLVSQLESEGYDPVILFPNDKSKHYRVSIFRSVDRSAVSSYASNAKKQGKRSGWILTLDDPSAVAATGTATARMAASPTTRGEVETSSSSNYHLIVGSFDEFDQADALVMALAEQNFEPYVIFPQGEEKKFRVSVYNASDRSEIEAYSTMLKKRGKEKGWIYEEKEPAPNTLTANLRMASRGSGEMLKYHLIGGSFKMYAQATTFAQESKSKGHSPSILFPQFTGSDRYRVSLYSSDNKKEVVRYRKQLEKDGKEAGWIYEKK